MKKIDPKVWALWFSRAALVGTVCGAIYCAKIGDAETAKELLSFAGGLLLLSPFAKPGARAPE